MINSVENKTKIFDKKLGELYGDSCDFIRRDFDNLTASAYLFLHHETLAFAPLIIGATDLAISSVNKIRQNIELGKMYAELRKEKINEIIYNFKPEAKALEFSNKKCHIRKRKDEMINKMMMGTVSEHEIDLGFTYLESLKKKREEGGDRVTCKGRYNIGNFASMPCLIKENCPLFVEGELMPRKNRKSTKLLKKILSA
jgi:hypothetical protein